MANSADPYPIAPLGAVWSRSTVFAQAYLSKYLGYILYIFAQMLKALLP